MKMKFWRAQLCWHQAPLHLPAISLVSWCKYTVVISSMCLSLIPCTLACVARAAVCVWEDILLFSFKRRLDVCARDGDVKKPQSGISFQFSRAAQKQNRPIMWIIGRTKNYTHLDASRHHGVCNGVLFKITFFSSVHSSFLFLKQNDERGHFMLCIKLIISNPEN